MHHPKGCPYLPASAFFYIFYDLCSLRVLITCVCTHVCLSAITVWPDPVVTMTYGLLSWQRAHSLRFISMVSSSRTPCNHTNVHKYMQHQLTGPLELISLLWVATPPTEFGIVFTTSATTSSPHRNTKIPSILHCVCACVHVRACARACACCQETATFTWDDF